MSIPIQIEDCEEPPRSSPIYVRTAQAFRRWLASTGAYISNLLLPPVCISCRTALDVHGALCPECWREVDFIRPPLCDRLGTPMPVASPGVTVSAAALANPPVFGRARAAASYAGLMRRLVRGLKYEDTQEVAPFCARLMYDAGRELLSGADVLVPVPLGRRRLLKRRYNQAALLAKHISRLSGVAFAPLALVRLRDTKTQVGLSQSERARNVAGMFAVPERRRGRIAGRRVVLVDDVLTTGATVNACAAALFEAGAASVDVLALARTGHGERD